MTPQLFMRLVQSFLNQKFPECDFDNNFDLCREQ